MPNPLPITDRSCLSLAPTAHGHVVRVAGRGTLRESVAIVVVADDLIAPHPLASLCLDLSQCRGLDSTFIGNLVALQSRFGRGTGSRFSVVESTACSALFRMNRIDRVLNIVLHAPDATGESIEIEIPELPPVALARHVLESHQLLVAAGGASAKAYAAIVERIGRALGDGPRLA